MRRSSTARVALGAMVCVLLACGGGGGGNGPEPTPMELFQGAYHAAILDGHGSPAQEITARWGTVTPDGAGSLPLVLAGNDNGSYTSTAPGPPITCAIPAV